MPPVQRPVLPPERFNPPARDAANLGHEIWGKRFSLYEVSLE